MLFGQAILVCAAALSVGDADPVPIVEEVRRTRLAGCLEEATVLAQTGLAAPGTDPSVAIGLYIELARIQDRFGLHNNTRPVARASAYADSAWARLPADNGEMSTAVLSLRPELAYRAEMDTDFPETVDFASRALALYRSLGDLHGEAEAANRLGLVALQRDRLREARQLFEESCRLDETAGARPFFQGEYERHIAFVELFEGKLDAARPQLQRSLELRRQSGAIDTAMFAANSLASALVDLGRPEDALEPLHYTVTLALSLDSQVGTARNSLVSGRLHAALGNEYAARLAFDEAIRIAQSVGSMGIADQAR